MLQTGCYPDAGHRDVHRPKPPDVTEPQRRAPVPVRRALREPELSEPQLQGRPEPELREPGRPEPDGLRA